MYHVVVTLQPFMSVWHPSLWCIMLWSDSRHLSLFDILLCDVSCCGQISDIYLCLTSFFVMYHVVVRFQTFIFVWHPSLWCIMLWSDSRHLSLFDILLCDVSCCGQIPDIYLCLTSFFVMYHVVVRFQTFIFAWHPSLWCIMLWSDSRHLSLFDILLCDVSYCGQIPDIYLCLTSFFVMYHVVVRFQTFIFVWHYSMWCIMLWSDSRHLSLFDILLCDVSYCGQIPDIYLCLTSFFVMYHVVVRFQTFIFVWHSSMWCIMLWSDSRHLSLFDILLCDVSCCGQIPDIHLYLTSFFVMYHVVVRFQTFIFVWHPSLWCIMLWSDSRHLLIIMYGWINTTHAWHNSLLVTTHETSLSWRPNIQRQMNAKISLKSDMQHRDENFVKMTLHWMLSRW